MTDPLLDGAEALVQRQLALSETIPCDICGRPATKRCAWVSDYNVACDVIACDEHACIDSVPLSKVPA